MGRVFLTSTHSHVSMFYKISRKPHSGISVLGGGFDTFAGSETHGDGQEQDLSGLRDKFCQSLLGEGFGFLFHCLRILIHCFGGEWKRSFDFFSFSLGKLQRRSLLWVGNWAE